jgi:hypothetical protein
MFRRLLPSVLAALAGLPALAYAQSDRRVAMTAAAPGPSGQAPASTLQSFRRWSADVSGPTWRAANDEMGRLAGHAGHLAPAAASSQVQRAPANAGKATPPATPAPGGHHHGARK